MDQNQASYLESAEVARILGSDLSSGLGLLEAQCRLKQYGPNRLDNHQHAGDLIRNRNHFYLNSDKQLAVRRPFLLRPIWFLWRRLSGLLLRLARQLLNPLLQLLVLSSAIACSLAEWQQALAILAGALLVCSIAIYQEARAESSLLASMAASQLVDVAACDTGRRCRVLRDGHSHEIEADFLVPGDVVQLDATSANLRRVPADLRLFEVRAAKELPPLLLDESNLMGHHRQTQAKVVAALRAHLTAALECGHSAVAIGASKSPQLVAFSGPPTPPGQTAEKFAYQNLALMGTRVHCGSARGLVIATGKHTQYGQVLAKLAQTRRPRSDLRAQIDRLGISLVVWACLVIALVAILELILAQPSDPTAVLRQALALFVVAVPEGLPVVAAAMMALGARRLAQRHALVRSLTSVETLGTIEVLCLGALPEELAGGDHDELLRASLRRLRERFGIEAKLITGDSRAQAVALARRLGLIENPAQGHFQAAPMDLRDLSSSSSSFSSSADHTHTPTRPDAQPKPTSKQQARVLEALAADVELDKFVMSGDQLARLLSTDHPDQSVKGRELTSRCVFYGLQPQQKAALVRELQHAGRVVAVAGNCLHDVLAMKRANLALAMGAGAEVCREVADVILSVGPAADQQAHEQLEEANSEALPLLVAAVAEGRAIQRKLHTFVAFQMSTSLALLVLAGLRLAVNPEGAAPLTALQLLAINVLAEGPPALLLAMGAPSESELASHWQQAGAAAAAVARSSLSLFTWRLAGAVALMAGALLAINGPLYVFTLDLDTSAGDSLDRPDNSAAAFQPGAQTLLFGSLVASLCLLVLALKLQFRLLS